MTIFEICHYVANDRHTHTHIIYIEMICSVKYREHIHSGIVLQISNAIYRLVFRTSEIDERDVIASKQFWNKYLLTTDRSRIPWEVAREMR